MGTPFISRDDLTDYLGRDVTADDGALIAVDAACDMVRSLAGQEFSEATDEIALDGTGTDALLLPQLPVTAAGTVGLIESTGGTTNVTDYYLDGAQGLLLRTRGSAVEDLGYEVKWPVGRRNVVVTYEHGFGTVDFPADVRMVALSVASRLIVQGVAQAETQGQTSVSYGMAATDFTAGERAILHKYRQIG